MSSDHNPRRRGGSRGSWRGDSRQSSQYRSSQSSYSNTQDDNGWPTVGVTSQPAAPSPGTFTSHDDGGWPTVGATSQPVTAPRTGTSTSQDAEGWPTVSADNIGTPSTSSHQQQQSPAPSSTRPSNRPKMPSSNPSEAGPSQALQSSHPPEVSQQGNPEPSTAGKKKKNRGKKRRNRRQSFAAPSDQGDLEDDNQGQGLIDVPEDQSTQQFYRLGTQGAGSNTSIESEALLDHRDQQSRPRRSSLHQNVLTQRAGASSSQRIGRSPTAPTPMHRATMDGSRDYRAQTALEANDDDEDVTDRTPLISRSHRQQSGTSLGAGKSGGYGSNSRRSQGRPSTPSSTKSSKRRPNPDRTFSTQSLSEWDVNNPPSRPESPRLSGQNEPFDDFLIPEGPRSPESRRIHPGEAIIDIDSNDVRPDLDFQRRRTMGDTPAGDVCLPFDNMTDVGDEDAMSVQNTVEGAQTPRRHRKRQWPDLESLEEFSREEKEGWTTQDIKAKKVDEPVSVGGRLRPQKGTWRRDEEELPFRWTYFNEELDSSLRSHTLSGLQQLGHSFRELFIPDRPEIEDDSSDTDDEEQVAANIAANERSATPRNGLSRASTRNPSAQYNDKRATDRQTSSGEHTGRNTPDKTQQPRGEPKPKPKKYGPRPVFWLDVLQPTYEEMRVLSRAFGIHKLTAEDIMEQEAREKVELFRNYYFVNYRTFEQDDKSDDYLEPINMYFVVFKGGVISFHFSQMPHPPNVRRRIRQLVEHQYTDSDWISYAIIDNITDAYAPLIEAIEKEVDDIDDEILQMHQKEKQSRNKSSGAHDNEKQGDSDGEEEQTSAEKNTGMLIRVGECRKKVMGLYRLLGNKADVIKGLAKRYNESVHPSTPHSDVGLYLGDIQDHIVTMTSNLTHYESILSRAHSNYLAQINIIMNERAEQTGDALNKLTVLGTIVLPMNVITGMWGMNCLVPGQDIENLNWFWGLTAFLFCFGGSCFMIAKLVYKIV